MIDPPVHHPECLAVVVALLQCTVGLDPLDVVAHFAVQAMVLAAVLVDFEVWALVHHGMVMTVVQHAMRGRVPPPINDTEGAVTVVLAAVLVMRAPVMR
jgi:hypothetical protein